jgi:hypothetical protein
MNSVVWCVVYWILLSAFPSQYIAIYFWIRLLLIMLHIRSMNLHNSNWTLGVRVFFVIVSVDSEFFVLIDDGYIKVIAINVVTRLIARNCGKSYMVSKLYDEYYGACFIHSSRVYVYNDRRLLLYIGVLYSVQYMTEIMHLLIALSQHRNFLYSICYYHDVSLICEYSLYFKTQFWSPNRSMSCSVRFNTTRNDPVWVRKFKALYESDMEFCGKYKEYGRLDGD